MVWMVTPLPVVMMPTMRSPGSGWQQRAKCTAMPGIRPRMAICPTSFLPRPPSPAFAALLRAREIGTTSAPPLLRGCLRPG